MPVSVKSPKSDSRKAKRNKDGLTPQEKKIADRVGAVGPSIDDKKIRNEYLYRFPDGQRVMFEKLLKKDCRTLKKGIEHLIWNYIRTHPSYDPAWEPEEDIL